MATRTLSDPRRDHCATLSRRHILPLVAALALPAGLGAAAAASPSGLIDILYNLVWIPDGKPWEKHAYVIFAPWCPYCKQLFNSSRSLVLKMQLRWIPAGSRNVHWRQYNASLAATRDPQQLAALFASGRIADAQARRFASIDLNEGVIAAHTVELSEAAGRAFGFPTVVYRDAAGVKAFNGVPANFATGLAAAASDSSYPVDGSKSVALLRWPMSETPLLDGQHAYGRRNAMVRALPFDDAPVVATVNAQSNYLALAEVATDAGRWVAVQFSRYDVRAYLPRADVDLRAA